MSKAYNLEIATKPMCENVFDYLVKGILPTLEDKTNNYLCISYEPVREDTVGCVQAARNGEGFHVEIIQYRDDGEKYHIFARDDVSLDDAIAIFRAVLVDFHIIDLDNWDEISETVRFYQDMKRFHRGQSMDAYEDDISLYLQRKWNFTEADAEKRISDYEDYIYGSYMYGEPVSEVAHDLEDIVRHPELYCPNEEQKLSEKNRQRLLLIEELRKEYPSMTPDQQDLIDAFAEFLMEQDGLQTDE